MKLLAWIDRVDECPQRGEPRPLFEDESGECIFPPEGHPDEKWWLTEMSFRKHQEQQARAEAHMLALVVNETVRGGCFHEVVREVDYKGRHPTRSKIQPGWIG